MRKTRNLYLAGVILAMFVMVGFIAGCGGGGGTAPNTSPKAVMAVTPGTTVRVGQIVTFDASGSSDAETKTADLKARWNYEGVWVGASSTVKVDTHRYMTPGTYTAKLAVSDAQMATAYDSKTITVYACNSNAQCDDQNPSTIDSCVNPGGANSSCSYSSVACSSDSACNDDNPSTVDTCNNPSTANSSCSHTPVACVADSDCNDNNAHTADSCNNPGTLLAQCVHAPIACLSNGDCHESPDNALTLDTCNAAGTTASSCSHTAFTCNSASDCHETPDNPLTIDSCTNGGTLASACVHTLIQCNTAADCNDHDGHTTDSCLNGGTTSALCSNVLNIECLDNSECSCQPGDPGCVNSTPYDPATQYGFCQSPGTVASQCLVTFF